LIAVEIEFSDHCVHFLPHLVECAGNQEWSTRKLAIDIFFTISAIIPDILIPYKTDIIEVLNQARHDKYKPVRETAVEAYQSIKSLGGELEKKEKPKSVVSQIKQD